MDHVPRRRHPVPCFDVLGPEVATSAVDLAAAVARVPADPLEVIGPVDAVIGGRPATHVAFTLGDDHGCQPGFFFRWPDLYGGPLWPSAERGDTISVWIAEVDGELLFIEGMATTEASPSLRQELQQFIDSVQFEQVLPRLHRR